MAFVKSRLRLPGEAHMLKQISQTTISVCDTYLFRNKYVYRQTDYHHIKILWQSIAAHRSLLWKEVTIALK